MLKSGFARCASFAAIVFAANGASADQAHSQLYLAGQLHTLVHETAASVCMINAGVAVEAEMQTLLAAHQSFIKTLAALSEGELADQAHEVKENWLPVDAAISMILAGDTPAKYAEAVQAGKGPLQFTTLSLLDQTSANYEHAEGVTMSDVLTVDLAERQEVFVQMMKLMACEMADEAAGTEILAKLEDTMTLYEASMDALTNGVPAIGLAAPEDYAVNQVLAAAAFDWQDMKPVLETIVANRGATAEDLNGLRLRAGAVDARMASLVDIYLAPADTGPVPQVAALGEGAE